MARVTVDDCIHTIPNRFQMTLAATYRARQLTSGATPMVDVDRDKPTVVALRELALRRAAQTVDDQLLSHLRERGVSGPWAATQGAKVRKASPPSTSRPGATAA